MTLEMDRRQGERRLTVLNGGRGKGPGMVTALRSQIVEHHMEDLARWAEVAEAMRRAAAYAEACQKRAYDRVRSWDNPEPAA